MKRILFVAPGVALAFVSKWLGLFDQTNLVNPTWQARADATALVVGTVAAALIGLLFQKAWKWVLIVLALLFVALASYGFYECLSYWRSLALPASNARVELLQHEWREYYVGSIITGICALSFASLGARQERPGAASKLIWGLLIPVCLVIIIVGFILLFR